MTVSFRSATDPNAPAERDIGKSLAWARSVVCLRHCVRNMARLTAVEKVRRDQQILLDRASGLSWPTLAARHDLDEASCRRIDRARVPTAATVSRRHEIRVQPVRDRLHVRPDFRSRQIRRRITSEIARAGRAAHPASA
jgi:hypothetical protein